MNKTRNVNSKVIFHNPSLCSEFLRDNIDIPILKNVRPEDIEDVSTQYKTYMGTEFEADTVKKVRIKEHESLYVISLIEHKSEVDYNVIVQLLKYMTCIWVEYAKEMEQKQKGISRNKNFRYPPILPIVYYEGSAKWTAALHLRERILMNEIFADYIPDFTYRLVGIHDYSNEELLNREDVMSFIMMLGKAQDEKNLTELFASYGEKVDLIILQATPEELQIIENIICALLRKVNATEEEIELCVEQVRRRQMGLLFENMQKMDIQAERKNTEEEAGRMVIVLCQKFGKTKAEAKETLIEERKLNETQAEEMIECYWKE